MSFSPFGPRHESPGPDAAPRCLRLVLLRVVGPGVTVGQGPALPHHPGVHVGAGQRADRKNAAVAVETGGRAGQFPATEMRPQFTRRRSSARPRLPSGIGAGLLELGCVDALEANAGSGHVDGVAVDDPRFADDGGLRRPMPGPVSGPLPVTVLGGPLRVSDIAGRARENDDDNERANVGPPDPAHFGVALVSPIHHRPKASNDSLSSHLDRTNENGAPSRIRTCTVLLLRESPPTGLGYWRVIADGPPSLKLWRGALFLCGGFFPHARPPGA